MKKIVIVDYGLGNLRSVNKAVEKTGGCVSITDDLEEIQAAEGIILPGVGAFHEGMTRLAELGQTLIDAEGHVPILGICLGMQMMLEFSEEHGLHKGLGLVPGRARRFEDTAGFKIPHMGWNQISFTKPDEPLYEGIPDGSYVYFVHSYWADTEMDNTLTTTDYISNFSSSIRKGTAIGVQFHPEKSGEKGLSIMRNFLDMI